ncbi:hypothetical protein [Methanoculleus chikugoensis]|uniref:hypothetical protein n=1 Tax=Methanoculleus chikugoensis TaxID=118126 RepID=UPI0006D12FC4|nr:hypothetical protein [Methanoculleus chikugoensis]
MACMNEDGQWIVLMGGLLVAVGGLFFLALIINQSVLVGQTTAEGGVLEFPKNDIRDLREAVFDYVDKFGDAGDAGVKEDIVAISLERKNAVVDFSVEPQVEVSGHYLHPVTIHYYNGGVTEYNENVYY